MQNASGNPYLPEIATVIEDIDETPLIKTLRVRFDNEEVMRNFKFEPGQVGQVSAFGVGEATFVINSPPTRMDYLQFSMVKTGEVTAALHKIRKGDKVGVRAPLGNYFPYNNWKGKNVFFIGGGIGMAPIRTIMLFVLDNKKDYGKVSLLYGAKTSNDMSYRYELEDWTNNPNLSTTLTVDAAEENWKHKVGLIPNVLTEIGPSPDNTIAVLCGPPIMIKFTIQALKKLNFPDEQIVTTLERRMKCGIGICGRCNLGEKYICVDGPVFTQAELNNLPDEL
jgi:NAD(P)H-flavin reductase